MFSGTDRVGRTAGASGPGRVSRHTCPVLLTRHHSNRMPAWARRTTGRPHAPVRGSPAQSADVRLAIAAPGSHVPPALRISSSYWRGQRIITQPTPTPNTTGPMLPGTSTARLLLPRRTPRHPHPLPKPPRLSSLIGPAQLVADPPRFLRFRTGLCGRLLLGRYVRPGWPPAPQPVLPGPRPLHVP